MNMTDMLLQMTLQSTWQLPQVSQSADQTANSQSQTGTTFQDLLNQRREDLQTGRDEGGVKEPEAGETPAVQPSEDEDQVDLQAAAGAAAPMLLSDLVPVQANFVEQTGPAGGPAVQTTVIEAVAPEVQAVQTIPVQTQAETVLPQAQTQVQEQPQQAVQTTQAQPQTQAPAAQGEAAQAVQPQTVETAAPAESQNQTQQDLPQDLTQSAAPQSETESLQDVTVEHFQIPLFREVESTPIRVGDGEAVDMTAPTQEVDRSLGDLLKNAVDQGEQRLEIKLSPANLGSVTAEFIRSPEGVLHVVLHAETEQTAKLLSDHASTLGIILQDSTRGEVRVQVAQPQENQSAWQHPDQEGGQQQQQQRSQQQNTSRQEGESFLHQLRLGLVQMGPDAV